MFYLKARLVVFVRLLLACKQAPGCSWRRGGKRKERLQLRLWIEHLHGKSQCKMLVGGDDISNNVITLGMCFAIFVYIRGCFRFVLIGGNMTSQNNQNNPESLLTGYIIVLF